jgi:hypothetical protein
MNHDFDQHRRIQVLYYHTNADQFDYDYLRTGLVVLLRHRVKEVVQHQFP